MGGADQWGNITAGLELIRRTSGDAEESPAHRIAYKLLLSPSGAKFGKSEGGESVWLDRLGRRPTRSTSTGSTPTTVTSGRTCAGSRCSSARTSRPWTRRWRRGRSSARRSDGSRSTSRRASTARRPHARPSAGAGRLHAGSHGVVLDDLVAMREQVRTSSWRASSSGTRWPPPSPPAPYPSKGEGRRQMANGEFYVNNQRITDPAAPLPERCTVGSGSSAPVSAPSAWSSRPVTAALRPAPETATRPRRLAAAGLEALRALHRGCFGRRGRTLLYPFAEESAAGRRRPGRRRRHRRAPHVPAADARRGAALPGHAVCVRRARCAAAGAPRQAGGRVPDPAAVRRRVPVRAARVDRRGAGRRGPARWTNRRGTRSRSSRSWTGSTSSRSATDAGRHGAGSARDCRLGAIVRRGRRARGVPGARRRRPAARRRARQQHERVVDEVCRLAGQLAELSPVCAGRLRRLVVLRREQHLGRLLGDLRPATSTPPSSGSTVYEPWVAARPLGDRRPQVLEPQSPARRRSPRAAPSGRAGRGVASPGSNRGRPARGRPDRSRSGSRGDRWARAAPRR